MPTILIIFLTAICYGLCWLCLWAEQRSKKWYRDRALLFTAGMFLSLAFVGTAWAVVKIL